MREERERMRGRAGKGKAGVDGSMVVDLYCWSLGIMIA